MKPFEPELGQMLFSGATTHPFGMEYHVEMGIHALGAVVTHLCEGSDPTSNTGVEFGNDVFSIRAYCWCDNDRAGHEEGCPPNFASGDFSASWYKHAGRGNSQSRLISTHEWRALLVRCLTSLDETP